MALVSVIVPCYNQGEFLSEAIQSVVHQTHQSWECIVVNDGSTDNTDGICRQWMSTDSRVKFLSKNNGGLSSARNEGLRLARGKYLQFLDADDTLEPTKLQKQLKALKHADDKSIAICDHFPFDHETRQFTPRMYKSPYLSPQDFKKEIITEWEFRRSFPPHSLLIPRSLVLANNLTFNEGLPTHEDWAFWCQLFYFSSGLCFQKEALANFRMRSTSMSNNKELMAQGFLAATFFLETFYNKEGAENHVRCVRKMRKEVKNNLFSHSALHNYYAEIKQRMKYYLRMQP